VTSASAEFEGSSVAPREGAHTESTHASVALDRLHESLLDDYEEELELELGDIASERAARQVPEAAPLLREVHGDRDAPLDRNFYFRELLRLQRELVRMQKWVAESGFRLVVLFEGRDAAGKGGAIKRITQRLNPRVAKVVALPAPNSREKTQWYFQRYVAQLPAAGEIVFFDRSWYNRAGVEQVMGFCSEEETEEFYRTVPELERMLTRSGIKLVKYWFSITDEEQHLRFLGRINDPLKQWKLSPMDLESRRRWEKYTLAKQEMFKRTHIAEAPWWVIPAVDKKRARLNCIRHLLTQVPYGDVPDFEVALPDREHHPDYRRESIPEEMIVPQRY